MGASADPAKWGHWLARRALKGRHRREVFLVNRAGRAILGQPAYGSLATLPQPPELVVIALPAAGLEPAVDDCLAARARAIVAISAGVGERDEKGQALERALADRVRGAGAVLVGPNCLGVADTGTELDLAIEDFLPGPVGLISQSGNLALELALLAREAQVGFSRFVSLGNQADLDATECVHAFIDHEPTRVIAVYLEDFRDGRAFVPAAAAAASAGKPVVLLTVGRTAAAARAARSHTASIVSDSAAVEAACRASGAFRVDSPQQMIDLVLTLAMPAFPRGRRTAVVGDGGGHVALAADRLAARGLVVEPFSDALAARLAALLPPTASTGNPVDLAGGGEADLANFGRVVREIVDAGEADSVLLTGYFGGYSQQSEGFAQPEIEAAEAMCQAATAGGTALVVQTMFPALEPARAMRRAGVPVFADIDAAARALGAVVDHRHSVPFGVPPAAPASSARSETLTGTRSSGPGYFAARRLIAEAGIPFVEARQVDSLAAAQAAATELGYPIVVKNLGRLHKSDAGGVRVVLRPGLLASAFLELQGLGGLDFSVERQAPVDRGVELLIGVKRDTRFGPVALVGLGGVFTEVLGDVAVALAPVSEEQAEMLIRSLRSAGLMLGSRGRPRLDVAAAARALSALSWLAAEHANLHAVEVNPLLVLESGVLGLDARVDEDSAATAER